MFTIANRSLDKQILNWNEQRSWPKNSVVYRLDTLALVWIPPGQFKEKIICPTLTFESLHFFGSQFFLLIEAFTKAFIMNKTEWANIVSEKVEKTGQKTFLSKTVWASKVTKRSEWKGRKNRTEKFSHIPLYGWFVCVSVRLCVCLCFGKSWITFEWINQFRLNF